MRTGVCLSSFLLGKGYTVFMLRVLLQCVTALEHVTNGAAAVDLRLRLGLLAHLQLLPLGLVDEQLAGLGALKGADDAPLLHLIHQTGGTGIAQLQAALEHGDGCLSRFQNHLHGSGQQLVAIRRVRKRSFLRRPFPSPSPPARSCP